MTYIAFAHAAPRDAAAKMARKLLGQRLELFGRNDLLLAALLDIAEKLTRALAPGELQRMLARGGARDLQRGEAGGAEILAENAGAARRR